MKYNTSHVEHFVEHVDTTRISCRNYCWTCWTYRWTFRWRCWVIAHLTWKKYLQMMRHRTPHVESFVADVETSHTSCWAFNCRCWSIIHLLIYLWLWMLMYNSCHVDSLVVYAETSHIVFWIFSCKFWSITHLGMIFRRNAFKLYSRQLTSLNSARATFSLMLCEIR